MIVPLYIISLGLAAGLAGVAGHHFFSSLGFTPDFHGSLMLASGIASGYLALQLLYTAVVRLIKPSKGPAFYLFETLSQASAIVLIPYLLKLPIPWPHPALQKVEFLVFLGIFAILHGFCKLVSFFSAIRGVHGNPFPAVGWLAAAALCAFSTYHCFHSWNTILLAASSAAPGPAQLCVSGSVQAPARSIPERTRFSFDVSSHRGKSLVFRWAAPPALDEPIERMSMLVSFNTPISLLKQHILTLAKDNWTRSPAIPIPENAQQCTVFWSLEKIPDWLLHTGMTPVGGSNRRMLLAGPSFPDLEKNSDKPSFVVIALDGVCAEHLSALGYDRDTSPALKSFSTRAHTFEFAYTPAPETAAALTTLLTGVNPLAHGQLGRHSCPLPNGIRTLPEIQIGRAHV